MKLDLHIAAVEYGNDKDENKKALVAFEPLVLDPSVACAMLRAAGDDLMISLRVYKEE